MATPDRNNVRPLRAEKIKIENVAIKALPKGDATSRQAFTLALRALKVGQSFVVGKVDSNHRTIINVVEWVLNREFTTRKDVRGYRVGRIG